ncbi:MAG: PQQ-binding-like beta-propeller repeat protein [Chiayiivirga sp.]|uniref:outer membrane protein assembly factor BamB family protein n=1 Tax=Chiayiivirga sp. TaxID=2041042 RepID=UPI0025C1D942|nr:PQQ-binding-like beta-propeller repeat protein [Chiayiivirga sp.]MCI1709321.1 PQQ-binding-like beta-propeller repeat protein [Chiayiivirga sp.]MCI1730723.1 PQQ-binding-like beta-propeller repeat protein [Chiayiivirga sp.]
MATQDLPIHGVLPWPEGGFLVSGETANTTWLVRYSAEGAPVSRQPIFEWGDSASRSAVTGRLLTVAPPVNDGIFTIPDHLACRLQRAEIDVRQFSDWILPWGYSTGDAIQIGVLNDWDTPNGLARTMLYGPDCEATEIYRSERSGLTTQIPGTSAAYVLDSASIVAGESPSRVLRKIDRTGVLWQRQLAPPSAGPSAGVSWAIASNADAVTRTSQVAAQAFPGRLARYDANGNEQWSRVEELAMPYLSGVYPAPDATYLIRTAKTREQENSVEMVANDGATRWSANLSPPYFSGNLPSARPNASPPWVLRLHRLVNLGTINNGLGPGGLYQAPGMALVRPEAGGLTPMAPLRTDVDYVAELADGALLARGLPETYDMDLRLLKADGSETRVSRARVPMPTAGIALLPDRDSVFFAEQDDRGAVRLHHLSRDGHLRWTIPLTTPPNAGSYTQVRLAAAPDRVCIVGTLARVTQAALASCYARLDGHAYYVNAATQMAESMQLRVTDDGSAEVIGYRVNASSDSDSQTPRQVVHSRIDALGAVGPARLIAEQRGGSRDRTQFGLSSHDGSVVVAYYNDALGKTSLIVRSIDGSERWSAVHAGELRILAIDRDGSLLTALDDLFVDFDANGRQRWSQRYSPALLPEDHPIHSSQSVLAPNGDRIITFRQAVAHRRMLMRVSKQDGSVVWQRQVSARDHGHFAIHSFALAPAANAVFLATRAETPLQSARALGFDLDSGRPVAAVSLPSPPLRTRNFWPGYSFAALDDGSVLVADDIEEKGQIALTKHSSEQLFGASTDRLQASLLGAWYAEDTPGQGLMFDFDPATRAAYGGWFTYSTLGGHMAAQQRWYSLSPVSATQAADSSEIELDIFRNRGGRFAEGPITTSERVGSARLRQLGCDRALFVYRFESADESQQESAIPLRRSYARTRACAQTPGETTQVARAARGIDPRSAGIWYDPAHSGQGVMFDLRPPQGSDPGLVAGAWFTYDVGGTADDPTAQHWFSLAGDLNRAQEGKFEVPIFRTLGGSLDGGRTNNTWRVGTASVTFADCSHARLDYAFDSSDVAHAFAAKRGSLSLQRIGGCGD